MNVVAIAVGVLERVTAKRVAKAKKRNVKAISRVKKAKEAVDKSNFEYNKQLIDVGVQLTKIQAIGDDINQKAIASKSQGDKFKALLQDIED